MRWLFLSQVLQLFELLAIVLHHFLFFLWQVWLIEIFLILFDNFIILVRLSLIIFLQRASFLHHGTIGFLRGALRLGVTGLWVADGIIFIWVLVNGSKKLTIGLYHAFICLTRKRLDLPWRNFFFFDERRSIDGEVFFCWDNTTTLNALFGVKRLKVVDARHWSIGTWLWSLLRYLNTDRLDLFFVNLA